MGGRPSTNWLQLKFRLLDCFGHTRDGNLCEQFLSLWKEGSVRDYLQTFKLLAATLDDMLEHIQKGTFINCLKPEIMVEVRMMKPEGFREVMKFTE